MADFDSLDNLTRSQTSDHAHLLSPTSCLLIFPFCLTKSFSDICLTLFVHTHQLVVIIHHGLLFFISSYHHLLPHYQEHPAFFNIFTFAIDILMSLLLYSLSISLILTCSTWSPYAPPSCSCAALWMPSCIGCF